MLIMVLGNAQTMTIGIFNSKKINAYTISIRQGKYLLECDGEKFGEYKKNYIFHVSRNGDKIEVRGKNNLIGIFKEVKLSESNQKSIITIKGVNPNTKAVEYEESVYFKVDGQRLRAINHVDLEKYIAGVIEAEGGISAKLEYYKAQAVLIRTYTIKNIYKHAEEGFNLCDGVHCQAYHGRNSYNKDIYRATLETAGEVLIDADSILVMSPFHSSCGGRTNTAGNYWQSDLPYLQTVNDPFCSSHKDFYWQKDISLMDWFAFLRSKGISNPDNYTSFAEPKRQKYFLETPSKISLRQIREQFKLRSTYFSFHKSGSKISFRGTGYGHGIGMCQIGAMQMAQVGYSYLDIIHFYFQHVNITDYREMELHRY